MQHAHGLGNLPHYIPAIFGAHRKLNGHRLRHIALKTERENMISMTQEPIWLAVSTIGIDEPNDSVFIHWVGLQNKLSKYFDVNGRLLIAWSQHELSIAFTELPSYSERNFQSLC